MLMSIWAFGAIFSSFDIITGGIEIMFCVCVCVCARACMYVRQECIKSVQILVEVCLHG